MDDKALQAQLRQDPRVLALVEQRGRTGIITSDELQALGYDVPSSYQFRALNPRSGQTGPEAYGLTDNSINGVEWLPVVAGSALLGAGAAGVAGAGPLASASGSTGAASTGAVSAGAGGAAAATTGAAAAAAPSLAGTLLKYGIQYGLPVAGGLIGAKMQASANTDAARLEYDYNNRALDAALEEQTYRRGFDEDERDYQRTLDTYTQQRDVESTNAARRNYGNFVQTLEPYRASGQAANQFASRLLGQDVPAYTGGTYYDLAREAQTPVSLPAAAQGDALPSGLTTPRTSEPVSTTQPVSAGVRMQAPTGEVQTVAPDQVAYYERLGARRI